jgi:hypothetical protein
MAEVTAEGYVLQLFIAEHAGHTQTKRVRHDGKVEHQCSCGTTLVLSRDS